MRIDRKSLRTGIPLIDRQHEEYFELLERLLKLSEGDNVDRSGVEAETANLLKYAIEHFDAEESLMYSAHYPHYKQHLAKHNRFRDEVDGWTLELSDDLSTDDCISRLSKWLLEWFCDQIKTDDMKLAAFLKKRTNAKIS